MIIGYWLVLLVVWLFVFEKKQVYNVKAERGISYLLIIIDARPFSNMKMIQTEYKNRPY